MLNLQIQIDERRKDHQLASHFNKENTNLIEVALMIQELERYKLQLLQLEFDGTIEGEFEK